MDNRIYFISGHLDLSPELFKKHYHHQVQEAINCGGNFIMGDAKGVDLMAQEYLVQQSVNPNKITIYHMFDKPRNLISDGIKTIGGFKSDEERDKQMTLDSNVDIAYVRTDEENKSLYGKKYQAGRISGTEKNLIRRKELKK